MAGAPPPGEKDESLRRTPAEVPATGKVSAEAPATGRPGHTLRYWSHPRQGVGGAGTAQGAKER